jgi:hypothetical protein
MYIIAEDLLIYLLLEELKAEKSMNKNQIHFLCCK